MEQGGTKQQRTGLVIAWDPEGAVRPLPHKVAEHLITWLILLYCCRHRDVECFVFILISESGGFLSAFTH